MCVTLPAVCGHHSFSDMLHKFPKTLSSNSGFYSLLWRVIQIDRRCAEVASGQIQLQGLERHILSEPFCCWCHTIMSSSTASIHAANEATDKAADCYHQGNFALCSISDFMCQKYHFNYLVHGKLIIKVFSGRSARWAKSGPPSRWKHLVLVWHVTKHLEESIRYVLELSDPRAGSCGDSWQTHSVSIVNDVQVACNGLHLPNSTAVSIPRSPLDDLDEVDLGYGNDLVSQW